MPGTQEEENLKIFSRLLIEVQEEERRAIARELHDEIGQSLTGLKLSVESIADSLPSDQADNMKAVEAVVGRDARHSAEHVPQSPSGNAR